MRGNHNSAERECLQKLITMLISVTKEEKAIFETIRMVLNEATQKPVLICVVGGWVRDKVSSFSSKHHQQSKVMGVTSNDLDFVVSGTTLVELEASLSLYKSQGTSGFV